MKSFSLESYYKKISRDILLVQSYTEQEGLAWIIKACRLKPTDKLERKIVLHNKWADEFGNSLTIAKDKKLNITINDLSVNQNTLTTDLYYGLNISNTAKISKMLYICYGQDDDDYNKIYSITYLGIDNYLRSFINWDEDWVQFPSLLLGMKHLKNISQNLDVRLFREFPNKENLPFPCISGKAWLTCLPMSSVFQRLVEKEHDALVPVLKHSKGL